MSDGGSAQPVVPVTTGLVSAAPALRVAVVSDGRPTLGGPSLPVYVVTDNRPTQGNTPVPVVLATGVQASNVMAGPAIPVVVVSGSLNPATPPVNTVLPVISGTLAIGSLLSTTDGTWTGTAPITYTYQWKRNGADIGGATANTYTLTASDPGTAITVTVTGTNVAGNASATSAAVNPSSLLASLVAYYKLNEASGTRADSTGRGNDLSTVTNAPGNAVGKVSNAIQIVAASSQSVSRASTADLQGAADWTIAAWVYLDSVGAERTIMCKSTEWILRYNTGSARFDFGWTDGGAVFRNVLANTLGALSLATWYFLVAIHDSSVNQIKISGNNGAFNTGAATGVTVGAAVATLGMRASVNFWDGRIDEVGIWKKVLSAAEITALYNGGSGNTYPF